MNAEALYLQRLLVIAVCAARPMSRRRAYGTGSLFTEPRADGRESWYAQFRVGGRLVKRALGPKRGPRSPDGLTRTQAERTLRRLIEATRPLPPERLTVTEAGDRLVAHLAELGRKRSTLSAYESCLRVHLVPFFGTRRLHRITRDQGEAFVALKTHEGLAPKSVLNYLGVLHSIFAYAERRGLVAAIAVVVRAQPPGVTHHVALGLHSSESKRLTSPVTAARLRGASFAITGGPVGCLSVSGSPRSGETAGTRRSAHPGVDGDSGLSRWS
ncbi:MAG: hypothetical protein ACJ77Z_17585 [Thermoleophilaceae bacterium]